MEKIVVEKNDSAETIVLKILGVCEVLEKTKMQITNNECKRKLDECFDSLFEITKKSNRDDIKSKINFVNNIIDKVNEIMESYSLKEVVLKSTHPEEYDDLVIVCKVIPNDKIGEYLENIPDSRKFYAYKNKLVKARKGKVGEVIKTTLKTKVNGREYILGEEENTVKERTYTKRTTMNNGDVFEQEVIAPDMVITNYHSTSNEEYVVNHQKFMDTYEFVEDDRTPGHSYGFSPRFMPKYDSRLLTQVDENVIITTAWGAPAVCLDGSYIVTYNADENDYNTLEKGAFESTYTKEEQPTKKLK